VVSIKAAQSFVQPPRMGRVEDGEAVDDLWASRTRGCRGALRELRATGARTRPRRPDTADDLTPQVVHPHEQLGGDFLRRRAGTDQVSRCPRTVDAPATSASP
jgi:hypothetical protein